jgi:hypothetical protein
MPKDEPISFTLLPVYIWHKYILMFLANPGYFSNTLSVFLIISFIKTFSESLLRHSEINNCPRLRRILVHLQGASKGAYWNM